MVRRVRSVHRGAQQVRWVRNAHRVCGVRMVQRVNSVQNT